MISVKCLISNLLLCVFFLSSCGPFYHDYREIPVFVEEFNSGKKFDLEDIEKLHGGDFIFRLEYLVNENNYIVEARTFETITGKFHPPKVIYAIIFYYKNNELYGVLDPTKDDCRPFTSIINDCFKFCPLQISCFERFNNQIQTKFSGVQLPHRPDRPEIIYTKEELCQKEEPEKEEPEKVNQVNELLSGTFEAFMSSPPSIEVWAPLFVGAGIYESHLKSSWKGINTTISVGDSFQSISPIVENIPKDTKYFINETGYAYFRKSSGDPVVSFGVLDGEVIWIRKCRPSFVKGICAPPQSLTL